MAKGRSIADLIIKLEAQGFQQLEGIRKELNSLASTTRLSNSALASAAKEVLQYGKRTSNTTASVKAQITVLKSLRDQVGLTSRAYKGMTGEINKLQQIQKGGFSDKQLLAQITGAKPRTIKAQIGASLREVENSSLTDGSYSKALLDATRRQERFNDQLQEQALITKNLFQMDQSRGLTTTRYELPDPQQGSEGIKALAQKNWFERFLHAHISSPLWKKATQMPDPGEVSPYGGYKARRIEEKTDFKYGTPLQLALPQTTNALQFGLKKVQEELGDLTIGSTQYHRVLGQVAEAQHKYNRALSQTTRDLKNATNMRPVSRDLLTARRNLAGSRRVRGRVGSGFSEFSQDAEFGIYGDGRAIQKALARRQRDQAKIQGFTKARNNPMAVSGLYDQISNIGMSKVSANIDRMGKSWRTVRKDIRAATEASNGSISSLQAQKSAFEQLRAGLDPTSKAFRQLTKDISKVDAQLNKLNSNKFSGQNLGRAAQGILGASFFGGPAGFLGSSLGVGFEALRKGGNLQQGAITGGLVASQVAAPVMNYASGAASYTAQIDKDRIALREITKTQENYKVALKATELATKNLNIPQDQATKGMTRLSAAVLGAGGNIEIAATSYLNVLSAIKGTAGGAEDAKSAITAMVQIFSKGRVSAEELSGQLGERFPAAVTEFAKANNISAATLQAQLKNGEVGLDMLLKFVNSLVKFQDSALKIGESPQEAGARLLIQMNEMKIEVGKVLQGLGADFQELGKELAILFMPMAKGIAIAAVAVAKGVLKIGQGFAWLLKRVDDITEAILVFSGTFATAFAVMKVTTNFGLIADGLLKVQAAMKGISVSAFLANFSVTALNKKLKATIALVMKNPYLLGAALVAGIGTAAYMEHTEYTRMAKNIADGTVSLTDAQKELDKLRDTMKEVKESMSDPTKSVKGGILDFFQNKVFEGGSAANTDIRKMAKLRSLEAAEGILEGAMEAAKQGNQEEFKELMELWTSLQSKFESMGNKGKEVYEGLAGGVRKWSDEMKKMGEEIANTTASWLDRLADQFSQFVMTGKFQFKEFARSIIADIARMIAKQMIFNMIAGFSGGGNFLSGLFGGGTKTVRGSVQGSGLFAKDFDDPTAQWAKGGVFAKNGIVPYAKGGIVNSPTLFPFAKGVGLMAEAGPEAIVPLKRGRDGKLGVAGGGGTTTVNVSVDAKGTKVEGDGKQMAQLGRMLGSAIEMEIAKQKRPGGLLA